MANKTDSKKNKPDVNVNNLTKRQASTINKNNRKISANLNSLLDELSSMTYGVRQTDKVDELSSAFDNLLKSEITNLNSTADGDTTSFLTKLFSENNKRIATANADLEDIFGVNEGQLESFLTEAYKNRLIKQADLHEVASQLTELREAIGIIRDAIISSDVVDGHMSRNIKFDLDMEDQEDNYTPIIESMENEFKLHEKIKDFIIPKSLEYGEYYVYCVPYATIFSEFDKEKYAEGNRAYRAYESADKPMNMYEFVHKDEKTWNALGESVTDMVLEAVENDGNPMYRGMDKKDLEKKNLRKTLDKQLEEMLKNVEVNNDCIPLSVMEEGVDSVREFYERKTSTVYGDSQMYNAFTNNFMKANSIDNGMHDIKGNKKNSKESDYSEFKDCYIKLVDPQRMLPIELMNEVIGYYYIQEEDISPLSGILTSTVYYDKFDSNRNENNVLSTIAGTIVSAFDKKFLQKNEKFKKLIVEALNYYKLNNRKIKFQFIPKEHVIPFSVNHDENGHGTSVLEPSLFYAKLYLMLLLFKMMSILLNSNDQKINYIKQSNIEKNVANKINEIARKKQARQITLADMFSYTTLINKIGNGNETYIPVGKSDVRGIETEILAGQEVQINTDFMEMLKKGYICGTGVPDVLMN